jgi:ubiquinone/menaquinone biosynthesis C-methylase UbiE
MSFENKKNRKESVSKNPQKETSWGGVAHWYDELLEKQDGTFQKEVILPNLIRMLSKTAHLKEGGLPLAGQRILDVACGQGFFSREMTKEGAQVMGTDIANELIDIARNHPDRGTTNKISYFVAPADNLKDVPSGGADAVTIILAIQNIENIHGTMTECARVLKPGGKLMLVLNHPAFRIPKHSSWQWADEEGRNGVQYRRVDAYMSESRVRIDMNPGEDKPTAKKTTVSFHRPLQTYFKTLHKAGFAVSRLEEWISHKQSKPGPRAMEENRIRKEIPMFLALECLRIK